MGFVTEYWQKICVPLDGFLWHKDISHPIIRPLLRNEILAAGFCILAGAALYAIVPWVFWFGAGICCMAWIFWSWARFFALNRPGKYSNGLLAQVLVRFILRFSLLAVLLYLALGPCNAPVSAVLAGLIAGSILAFASYALNMSWQ